MHSQVKFQIGKNGITEGVLDTLATLFNSHKQVRISMLRSSGRDRDSIDTMAQKLVEKLSLISPNLFTYKKIGFTILLTRHPKLVKR
jgi:RNA-binding protein YhbY